MTSSDLRPRLRPIFLVFSHRFGIKILMTDKDYNAQHSEWKVAL